MNDECGTMNDERGVTGGMDVIHSTYTNDHLSWRPEPDIRRLEDRE